ncbi:MAG: hypothetical protein ACYS0K_12065 [Planctomycetota bacterium]|jgi:hypothetical protein
MSRGFRFSARDAVALTAAAVATWLLLPRIGSFAWLFPFALGHFFLFCNVFRVRRGYELIWAAGFLLNFGAWAVSGAFDWLGVLAVQTPLTLLLIGVEIRSPRYHGVFARAPVDGSEPPP